MKHMPTVLKAVWGKQSGFAFLCFRRGKEWKEMSFEYPKDFDRMVTGIVHMNADGYDAYWCPLLFDEPHRKKENVKPMLGLLWADLDTVDPDTLGSLRPTIAWKSSAHKYQALWALNKQHPAEDVEAVNQSLTYHIGADKSGWDITQVLRIPGSKNYKYDPPETGEFLWGEKRYYELDKVREEVGGLSALSEPGSGYKALEGYDVSDRLTELLDTDPDDVVTGERSDRLWEIETSLVELGLPLLDIVSIVKVCPWNKYKGRKDEDKRIYAEVLKADAHVKKRERSALSELPTIKPEESPMRKELWAVPYDVFTSRYIERPEWLVEYIWQRGTYGMISGEPKTYKSVLSTDMALGIVTGEPFLGKFAIPKTGKVLFIQEENNEATVQDRVFKIADYKGVTEHEEGSLTMPNNLSIYFSNNFGVDLTHKDSRKLIETTIEELQPDFILADPLYMMLGSSNENDATEMRGTLRWLTGLRNRFKCSILLCHHYNKAGSGLRGGQRIRGTSQFHAWVESALYVKATSEPTRIKIEREFRAFPHLPEIDVNITLGNPGQLLYRPTLEEMALSMDEDKATSRIKADICTLLSMKSMSFEELREELKTSRADAKILLDDLESDGLIVKSYGGGRGKKAYYELTKGGFSYVTVVEEDLHVEKADG